MVFGKLTVGYAKVVNKKESPVFMKDVNTGEGESVLEEILLIYIVFNSCQYAKQRVENLGNFGNSNMTSSIAVMIAVIYFHYILFKVKLSFNIFVGLQKPEIDT